MPQSTDMKPGPWGYRLRQHKLLGTHPTSGIQTPHHHPRQASSHPIRVAGFLSSRRVMRSSKAALTSGREPAWFRSESLESCLHSSECTWYNFKQYCNFVEDKQAC